jgi:hypothetical protein
MKSLCCIKFLIVFISFTLTLCFTDSTAFGAIIHESATMGSGTSSPAYSISSNQYLGSRFSIQGSPVQVTAIGGHVYCSSATCFGAIISLSGPGALPTGSPINLSEVVTSTAFGPFPAYDWRTPLSVLLQPGNYALVFGTDYLGAAGGFGGMPYDGKVSLPGASFFRWDGDYGAWRESAGIKRFVVEGYTVPEPATICLLGLGGLLPGRSRKFNKKRR